MARQSLRLSDLQGAERALVQAGHTISRVIVNADGSFEMVLALRVSSDPVRITTPEPDPQPVPPPDDDLLEQWKRDNGYGRVQGTA